MWGTENLRWPVSVLLLLAGAWCLADLARLPGGRRSARREAAPVAAARVLMVVQMVAMLWAWGGRIPVIVQITGFTAASAGFVALVLFGGPASANAAPTATGATTEGPHRRRTRRRECWYHAGMMAAGGWAALVAGSAAGPAGTAPVPSMPSMPGMASMPGMPMSGGPQGAAVSTPLPWADAVCVVLSTGFVAVAAAYMAVALRPARPGGGRARGGAPAGALVAAGTAGALLLLAHL